MKTESEIMASGLKSGSLKPIIQKMIEEFLEYGLQENSKISKTEFASYIVGQTVARIGGSNSQGDFGWTDKYIYQENSSKPMILSKTLQKPAFAAGVLTLDGIHKDIYAEIVLLPEAEMDGPMFWSGLLGEQIIIERERIGEKIKYLREKAGLTQDQLAEKTGLQRPNIARIESGRYSTGQDILSKIASTLGARLDLV